MSGLVYVNTAETATASGGSWLVGLPASNALSRDLSKVARSSNALTTSTKILLDNGSAVSARVLVIIASNLSASAQVKWSRGTTSGGTDVVAGTLINAWQMSPSVVNGTDFHVWIVQSATTSARYETLEIVDTSNPAGYVDIGQLFIGDVFKPTYGPSPGMSDGWKPFGGVERGDSGYPWVTARRSVRTVAFTLDALTLAEGDTLHELQRVAGVTGLVAHMPSLQVGNELQRYGFVGLLEELSPIEYPYYQRRRLALKLTGI